MAFNKNQYAAPGWDSLVATQTGWLMWLAIRLTCHKRREGSPGRSIILGGLLLIGLAVAVPCAQARQKDIELSPEERAWIDTHPKIVLGVEKSWEPLILQNPDGTFAGVDGDIVKRLNATLGSNITFEVGKWAELVEKLKKRQIDGLSASTVQEERRAFASFTSSYATYQKFIYVLKENPANINAGSNLFGKRVGHIAGSLYDKKSIEAYSGAIAVPLSGNKEVFDAALEGRIDAFVGSFLIEYQLARDSITHFKPVFPLPDTISLVFSIRNDWPQLIPILNKGLAQISFQERMEIKERYVQDIGKRLNAAAIVLSDAEKAWLKQEHTLRVRVIHFPPYMFTEPKPSGMAVDYLDLIAKRFGIKVELLSSTTDYATALRDVSETRQQFDALPLMIRTPERERQFAITDNYVFAPLVIFARKDSSYVGGLDGLAGKTAATEKGFFIREQLASTLPSIRVLEVDNTRSALEALAYGKADAYVGNLTVASYLIREHHLNNLMVVGSTPFNNQSYAMAFRNDWPELASLINKGLQALTTEERNAINQKWGAIEFRQRIDYTVALQVLAVSALLVAAFVYWNRKMAKEIERRETSEEALKEANQKLAELAITDVLTGLFNRRHFNETLAIEWSRARRNSQPLAVLMIDIDDFKKYNDRYGHQAGDECLVSVARILADKAKRAGDVAARYGGEEFVMIAPQTSSEQAHLFANEICRGVFSLNLSHADSTHRQVSVSIGVASAVPNGTNTAEVLLRAADDALYRAKQSGRNRVS